MGDDFCNNPKGSPVMGCQVATLAPPANPKEKPKEQVDPILKPATLTVVVRKFFDDKGTRKAYTQPKRQPIVLKASKPFNGKGTFTFDAKIKFFRSATKDDEIKVDGVHNVFKGKDLAKGITLFAEGAKASAKSDDIELKLQLFDDPTKTFGPDFKGVATSVEVTLDICKDRPSPKAAPPPLSQDDKIAVGRDLAIQGTTAHFHRAQLIVQVKPSDFTGTLTVRAKKNATAFSNENPKAGENEAVPYVISNASKIPAGGDKTLWAEGTALSEKPLDTGFIVDIKDVAADADHVNATVISDSLWLVACHPQGKTKDEIWVRYAHHSRPGYVWRMNDKAYKGKEDKSAGVPPAKLSVLSQAITSIGKLHTVDDATLVFMWHGDPDPSGPFVGYVAYLQSMANFTDAERDVANIEGDPDWNSYVFLFRWKHRMSNKHYIKIVDAIKALKNVTRIHLYGCRLGKDSDPDGIRDFTEDVQKEVWAYTGYTHTFDDHMRIIQTHDPKAKSSMGVRVKDKGGYEQLTLETPKGMLPGWQMRGYLVKGKVMVDTYDADQGWVETWDGTYTSTPLGDERTVKKTYL